MAGRGRGQRRKSTRGTQGECNGSNAAAPAARGGSNTTADIPNEWHKRSAELNPKYKSQLCKNFMEKGSEGCKFGDSCVFAHGHHELRVAQKDDVVAQTRRTRRGRTKKGNTDPNPRVHFRKEAELLCRECDSRPASPVFDEATDHEATGPVPEWAAVEIDPGTEFNFGTASTASTASTVSVAPLLLRSNSVLGADNHAPDDVAGSSTVSERPVVYGEEACATATDFTCGAPLLVRSDSVRAADSLFLDANIDTSTVVDKPMLYSEDTLTHPQISSRFSWATATPREDHPKQWNTSQVHSWVRSRGIPDVVAAKFVEHEVEGNDLLTLNKTELREIGVDKVGHLKKLMAGIAELNCSTTTSVVATNAGAAGGDALKSQPAGTEDTNIKRVPGTTPPSTVSAQAVGVSQLVAEATSVIKQSDNVTGLNEVLQSAVMANKIAEVIRGESDAVPVTLCMLAAKHRRVGCLQRLLGELAAQQTVNSVRVDDGCSALHLAAYSGSAGCVRLLLKAGADTSLVNRYGETAADSAAKRGHGSLSDTIAQTRNVAALPSELDSKKVIGRSQLPQPSERFTKIPQPRRHAKKSRDTLANELFAWRNGTASAA